MFPLRDNNPSETVPILTWVLIVANVLAFLLELSAGAENFVSRYGFTPALFFSQPDAAEITTIFSSMFLHGGWAHLLGNMWFLYLFGDNVEDRLGHIPYLVFYLLSGVAAAMMQAVLNPHSTVEMIGASGAISGVLGAYFVFFPQATVESLVPMGMFSRIYQVPAIVFLGLWFGIQLFTGFSSIGGPDTGGVAFWAHVGGFAFGLVVAKIFATAKGYS
jgi:membrane associated rhomboid family serine protease